MTRPAVGVIGLGLMGLPIALRLRDRGFEVLGCDIDPARRALATAEGLGLAPDPAALARQCERVLVVVVDAAQVHTVIAGPRGLLAAFGESPAPVLRHLLLCPTIAPAEVEAAGALLAPVGIGLLEAPMSGGPVRARDGTMSLMLAGPPALIDGEAALLDAMSDQQVRLGDRLGDGARTKLVNNLLAAVHLAAAGEAMALAERVGLDAARTLALIERSSGQSWIGSDRLRRALAGDPAPHAHLALLAKDSALALQMAQAAGQPLPVGERAAQQFADACAAGHARADDSALWAWAAGRLR